MTIREAIDKADALKPNQFTEEEKMSWLNALDAQIHEDIIKTHMGWDHKEFKRYESAEDALIVPFPFEEVYVSFLKMKFDDENGDTQRYNNSAAMYNAHYDAFAKDYNKKHLPIGIRHHRIY